VGAVIEMLGQRRGQMLNMEDGQDGSVRLHYRAPTRGLLGFRSQFLSATRGQGILYTLLDGYGPMAGEVVARANGSIVAWEPGIVTNYALKSAEDRGMLFVSAGDEVYEGMVVGERPKPGDLAVNVCRKKHLTAMHVETKAVLVHLNATRQMSLDEAIEYLADDELLEVTPKSFRIRKRNLRVGKSGKPDMRNKDKAA